MAKAKNAEASSKILLGQFFTIANPFRTDAFFKWLKMIPNDKKLHILEPFAGSNNIVKMIEELNILCDDTEWTCYDIAPNDYNAEPRFTVNKADTIKHFPEGFSVAITNPPYLAKNSATRKGLRFPKSEYDDMYKIALDVMLSNLEYVAAIIPESFITSGLFHDRLYAVISLTCKMFKDTDCPVCLALFVPHGKCDDFLLYRQNRIQDKVSKDNINNLSGVSYSAIKQYELNPQNHIPWKFNDTSGNIGIRCIDNAKTNSIQFVPSSEINADKIHVSSRSITCVSGLPKNVSKNKFIKTCNNILSDFREKTYDIFLTSFKGLREDGLYRRRLDFNTARNIMDSAIDELLPIKEKKSC